MHYHVVDVFAHGGPFTGNPLTVVHGRPDAHRRQAMARETNHSETTFVGDQNADGSWPVRIPTPSKQLPFAGHPTIGTAWALREYFGAGDDVVLDLPIGRVPVTFRDGLGWLTAPPAATAPGAPADGLAACLGLHAGEVMTTAVASTGLPIHIAVVPDVATAARADLDQRAFDDAIGRADADSVLVVSPADNDGVQLHARYFADAHGIHEDPATGSANASLAAWLRDGDWWTRDVAGVVVEQGVEIGRPSRLHLAADGAGVRVGGRVEAVAMGQFLV